MADPKPIGAETDYLVVDQSRLTEPELEGRELGGANVSLIFIDARPAEGPRLHRHPYEEIFVVLEAGRRSRSAPGRSWSAPARPCWCKPAWRTSSSPTAPNAFARSTST